MTPEAPSAGARAIVAFCGALDGTTDDLAARATETYQAIVDEKPARTTDFRARAEVALDACCGRGCAFDYLHLTERIASPPRPYVEDAKMALRGITDAAVGASVS